MIYHIYANRSNVGDWLSAKGIQKLLQPMKVREYLCDEPFVHETLEALSQATQDDLVVIGGGGLLMDYFEPFWEGFTKFSDKVPYVIWGIGVCDLKQEKSRLNPMLVKAVVEKSRYTVVRDEHTRDYILGIDKSLNLDAPVICPSVVVLESSKVIDKGMLHSNNYTTAGSQIYETMRAKAMKFAEKTGRKYRETNNRIEMASAERLDETLMLYAKSDLIISSALHGCIIGVTTGRKVLAVSGDWKIDSYMKAVGLKDWVLDLDEMEQFEKKLEQLEGQVSCEAILSDARKGNKVVAERVKHLVSDKISRTQLS